MTVKAVSRHRQTSTRSIDDKADELSSWLGDDVCANCGASAQPHHLYCSQECKEEDAKQVDIGKSSRPSTSAPLSASSSTKKTSSTPFWAEAIHSNDNTKFRYPCPTSPNIVAKYNSALTSPALVALERSLPDAAPRTTTARGSQSISSSGEGSSVAQAKSSKRRSSSRSTFSSASDVVSTEHSTPQSMSEAIEDEDDDALDASDFHLPPSIRPSSILLSSTAREDKMAVTPSTSITPDGTNCSPVSRVTPTSHQRTLSSKTSAKTDAERKTLDFARRPSTTNLPPMLAQVSPMMKPFKCPGNGTVRRQSSLYSQASLQEAQATLRGKKSITDRVMPSSAAMLDMKGGKEKKGAVPMLDALFQHRRVTTEDSPPHLASASSSAGKTLRALSPLDSTVSAFNAAICGRYGCSGLGSSVESLEKNAVKGSFDCQRPSMTRGHKHTHSAAAGLNLLNDNHSASLASSSKLTMTSVTGNVDETEESPPVKLGSMKAMEELSDEGARNPPRGRSKARGRRSASHRSPSPARGGARRGRSEDLMKTLADGPVSPASVRTQPMALPQSRRSPPSHDFSDDDINERRGRSPTERNVPLSSVGSRQRNDTISTLTSEDFMLESCEMAWPGYGHDLADRREITNAGIAQKIASAIIHGSQGYDDVDLDEL